MSDKLIQIFDTQLAQPQDFFLKALEGTWGSQNGSVFMGKVTIGVYYNVKQIEPAPFKRVALLCQGGVTSRVIEANETLKLNIAYSAVIVLSSEV